jgi:hypothetical protein
MTTTTDALLFSLLSLWERRAGVVRASEGTPLSLLRNILE